MQKSDITFDLFMGVFLFLVSFKTFVIFLFDFWWCKDPLFEIKFGIRLCQNG